MNARHVLAIASFAILAVVALGLLEAFIPAFGALMQSAQGTFGYVATKSLTALMALSVLVAWGAALYHASTWTPWPLAAPRWIVIMLLVLGNAVAAIVYYFLALHWRAPGAAESASGATRSN